jgi:hypothetical protein
LTLLAALSSAAGAAVSLRRLSLADPGCDVDAVPPSQGMEDLRLAIWMLLSALLATVVAAADLCEFRS